ncbi:MAG: hypothetical protein Q9191_003120 [Dirinaria sp. TL-2023a]
MSPALSAQSNNNQSRIHTPASSVASTPVVPDKPPSPEKKALQDSNAFLTALATQERKVLELREELQRAEASLDKLKRQWAMHEATKKRNERRHVEQLQPLSTSLMSLPDLEDKFASDVLQDDRGKLRSSAARSTQRTVFKGSRHTKTLSLLSSKPSIKDEAQVDSTGSPLRPRRETTSTPLRSRTAPHPARPLNGTSNITNTPRSRQSVGGPPKDAILETGKQLVGDFREGFWTFFEDLRQATAGEEIDTSNGHVTRKPISNVKAETSAKDTTPQQENKSPNRSFPARASSLHGKSTALKKSVSNADGKSQEASAKEGNLEGSSPKLKAQRDIPIQTTSTVSDGWDSWDSPPRTASPHQSSNMSNSISDSMTSSATDRSSPRTSLSSTDATPRARKPSAAPDDRKDIPLPTLTKLSPGNLKRTASTLMNEWERSLTPSIAEGPIAPSAFEPTFAEDDNVD